MKMYGFVLSGYVAWLMIPLSGETTKTKLVEPTEPSVAQAMGMKESIIIPLNIMQQKYKDNELVNTLENIAEDLFKLSINKVATKYSTFMQARESFEQGFEASEFKLSYVRSWIELVHKRILKVDSYRKRLEAIANRLDTFDKRIKALKDIDEQLRINLMDYSTKIRHYISVTHDWLEKSRTAFAHELNALKSREKRLTKARVF
jgi:hypothetical protein